MLIPQTPTFTLTIIVWLSLLLSLSFILLRALHKENKEEKLPLQEDGGEAGGEDGGRIATVTVTKVGYDTGSESGHGSVHGSGHGSSCCSGSGQGSANGCGSLIK